MRGSGSGLQSETQEQRASYDGQQRREAKPAEEGPFARWSSTPRQLLSLRLDSSAMKQRYSPRKSRLLSPVVCLTCQNATNLRPHEARGRRSSPLRDMALPSDETEAMLALRIRRSVGALLASGEERAGPATAGETWVVAMRAGCMRYGVGRNLDAACGGGAACLLFHHSQRSSKPDMVLQNKYKARASKRYNAARGGSSSTSERGSTRGTGRRGARPAVFGAPHQDDSAGSEEEEKEEEEGEFPSLGAVDASGSVQKEEEAEEEGQIRGKYAKRKMESNAWRYAEPEVDPNVGERLLTVPRTHTLSSTN